MKLNPYTNAQHLAAIGIYPLITTLVLLALHYYSGALDWPSLDSANTQRNFNSAIGMSVLTGYLWFTIRMLHQNVASTLISILVKIDQLSQFSYHRARLASEFRLHIFCAAVISILLTVVYVVVEELLSTTQEFRVLVLTASAVPFWFFFWLFLFQITSNIRYTINYVLPDAIRVTDYLESLVVLIKLGVTNTIFSLGAFSLIPIFWFKKDIPSVDVFLVCIFSGSLAVYLIYPIVKLKIKLRQTKRTVLSELEDKISREIAEYRHKPSTHPNELELMESERENILGLSTNVIELREQIRLYACISLIPVSWLLVTLLEWLVSSPIHF